MEVHGHQRSDRIWYLKKKRSVVSIWTKRCPAVFSSKLTLFKKRFLTHEKTLSTPSYLPLFPSNPVSK